MSLIRVVPCAMLCKDGQHERKGDPRGRPGMWWGGGSGLGHPPAPREFRLVPLDQKDGCGRSCGNADIPSCAAFPVLEIDTAVFPLCSLMQCKC